jgi:hypothetical protein
VIGAALLLQVATATVQGDVVRIVGADTVAAAGARVVLHRVGDSLQGPLDSLHANADGHFRFAVRTALDANDVLLVSARWHGIEYFAPPVAGSTAVRVVVSDTSAQAAVQVAARHLVIGGPAPDGTRDVVDLLILRNAGGLTRTGPDSLAPTWQMRIPPHVANVQLGDADFARETFDLHGDTLFLSAPIPPGERQFFLQYQIPPGARTLEVPLEPAADTITVLAEEQALEVSAGLVRQGSETVAGRAFARWTGGALGSLALRFPGSRGTPAWLLPGLIAAVALPLAWITARAIRRPH